MFARGAIPEKVKTWCYDEDAEDFTKGMLIIIFSFIFECHNILIKTRRHWILGF
jgi:hypothetical protein